MNKLTILSTLLTLLLIAPSCANEEAEVKRDRSKNFAKAVKNDGQQENNQEEGVPLSAQQGLTLSTITYSKDQLVEIQDVKVEVVDLVGDAPGILISPITSNYGLPFEYKICFDQQSDICFPSEKEPRSFSGNGGISHHHLSGGDLRVSVRQCIRAYQTQANVKSCTKWVAHTGDAISMPSLEELSGVVDNLAEAEVVKSNIQNLCLEAATTISDFLTSHASAIKDPNLFAMLSNSALGGQDNCSYAFNVGLDIEMEEEYDTYFSDFDKFADYALDFANSLNFLSILSGIALSPDSLISLNSQSQESINLTAIGSFFKYAGKASVDVLDGADDAAKIAKKTDLADGYTFKGKDGDYVFVQSKTGKSANADLTSAKRALDDLNTRKVKADTPEYKQALKNVEEAQIRADALKSIGVADEVFPDTGLWVRVDKKGKGNILLSTEDIRPKRTWWEFFSRKNTDEIIDRRAKKISKNADTEALIARRDAALSNVDGAPKWDSLPRKEQEKLTPKTSGWFVDSHNKKVAKRIAKLEGNYKPSSSWSIKRWGKKKRAGVDTSLNDADVAKSFQDRSLRKLKKAETSRNNIVNKNADDLSTPPSAGKNAGDAGEDVADQTASSTAKANKNNEEIVEEAGDEIQKSSGNKLAIGAATVIGVSAVVGAIAIWTNIEDSNSSGVDGVATGEIDESETTPRDTTPPTNEETANQETTESTPEVGSSTEDSTADDTGDQEESLTLTTEEQTQVDPFEAAKITLFMTLAEIYDDLQDESFDLNNSEAIAGQALKEAVAALEAGTAPAATAEKSSPEAKQAEEQEPQFDAFGNPIDSSNTTGANEQGEG